MAKRKRKMAENVSNETLKVMGLLTGDTDPREYFGPRTYAKEFGVWLMPDDWQRLSNAMKRAGESAYSTFAAKIILEWMDAHLDECQPLPEPEQPDPPKPYVPFEKGSPFTVEGDINWKPEK